VDGGTTFEDESKVSSLATKPGGLSSGVTITSSSAIPQEFSSATAAEYKCSADAKQTTKVRIKWGSTSLVGRAHQVANTATFDVDATVLDVYRHCLFLYPTLTAGFELMGGYPIALLTNPSLTLAGGKLTGSSFVITIPLTPVTL